MDEKKDDGYTCEVCGGEAELLIEGFDTVKDVMKIGSMNCRHCSSAEDVAFPEQTDDFLKAVGIALTREKEAHLFYKKAAQKTSSGKGKDMFNQLAAFEMNHYKKIAHLCHSLQRSGRWVPYLGQEELKPSQRLAELKEKKNTKQDDIDALTMAISKEEEAAALYREMAEKTEDPTGRDMFKKLTAEEEVHQKILNAQLYSLANQGIWLWGD
ncbi:MAG: hypothetical protein GTN74_01800 [Proteobacteria bacterium]|nr:hypothetical protein [Pseudomonadota bacterium]NIS67857.1 hypothetical protein [Pseudomonadota bacterium]